MLIPKVAAAQHLTIKKEASDDHGNYILIYSALI